MDKQQVFNKVAKHLLAQDAQSLEGTNCRYRSPEGLQCAVGCLINDENYTEELEDIPSDKEPVRKAVAASLGQFVGSQDAAFLTELQKIHDYEPPSDWARYLDLFAQKNFNGKDLNELGILEG